MNCEVVMAQSVAERYLTGDLTEDERSDYEAHYFSCLRCFDELRTLQAATVVLADEPSRLETAAGRSSRTGWPWLALAAGLAVVAMAGLWLTKPGPPPPVSGTGARTREAPSQPAATSVAEPSTSAPSASASEPSEPAEDPVLQLAQVRPPPYVPMQLRGAPAGAAQSFTNAMALYTEGRIADAVPLLEEAAQQDSVSPAAPFYLGACYLLTGRPDAALARLNDVIGRGETPYLEEAWFLKAKALLAKRALAEADAALVTVIGLNGDREDEARRLLREVKALADKE